MLLMEIICYVLFMACNARNWGCTLEAIRLITRLKQLSKKKIKVLSH